MQHVINITGAILLPVLALVGVETYPTQVESKVFETTQGIPLAQMTQPSLWEQSSEAERECMALNVYHEARGETILGQIGVAQVTLNRVELGRFPDTICGVVWQSSQFSWTNDGISDTPSERDAWARAQVVAQIVMETWDASVDLTYGADHYHAHSVTPRWGDPEHVTTVIGDHIFYDLY